MNGSGLFAKSWVLRLIIINVIVYFLQILLQPGFQVVDYAGGVVPRTYPGMTFYFGLIPQLIIEKLYIWQLFTYMFLHNQYSFMHIFFNMYALLLFGMPIEQTWGSKRFIFYYLFTGIGAGLCIFGLNSAIGGVSAVIPTIGASGAVFGILLAFGILFPEAEILLFFFIPMKARVLVFLYGGIEVALLIFSRGQGGISHIGHVGGLLFGIIYFLIIRNRGITFKSKIIKARLQKELDKHETKKAESEKEEETSLRDILIKVREKGYDSLSDDEIQFVRYMSIMHEETDDMCVEEDFKEDDDYCLKCSNVNACLIREIKKYTP